MCLGAEARTRAGVRTWVGWADEGMEPGLELVPGVGAEGLELGCVGLRLGWSWAGAGAWAQARAGGWPTAGARAKVELENPALGARVEQGPGPQPAWIRPCHPVLLPLGQPLPLCVQFTAISRHSE